MAGTDVHQCRPWQHPRDSGGHASPCAPALTCMVWVPFGPQRTDCLIDPSPSPRAPFLPGQSLQRAVGLTQPPLMSFDSCGGRPVVRGPGVLQTPGWEMGRGSTRSSAIPDPFWGRTPELGAHHSPLERMAPLKVSDCFLPQLRQLLRGALQFPA